MVIEELTNFDKEHLTYEALIGSKHDQKWRRKSMFYFVLSIGVVIACVIYSLMRLSSKSTWHVTIYDTWLLLAVPAAFSIKALLKQSKRRVIDILKREYNEEFNLNITNSWNKATLSKIQYLKLASWLKSRNANFDRLDARTIIESLKHESVKPKYNYISVQIGLISLGALLGGLIGSILNLGKTYDDVVSIFAPLLTIGILLTMSLIYLEVWLIKDFLIKSSTKYDRLIKILENYSINCIRDELIQ